MLLNFANTTALCPVTSTIASSTVHISDLRLGDARALLGHGSTVGGLPNPVSSPTAFVQGVIDGLCELSLKDPLTGLPNRRHFRSVLEREIDGGRNGKLLIVWRTDTDPPSTNLHCRDSANVRQQRNGKSWDACVSVDRWNTAIGPRRLRRFSDSDPRLRQYSHGPTPRPRS